MRIKTITCHNVYNYGASLQAYALQHYLEILGNDVEIIDFQPYFHQNRYNLMYVDKRRKVYKLSKLIPFSKYIIFPYLNRGMRKTWGRKRAFDNFTETYLPLTQRYETSEELKQNPPVADIYVAGSDQIWNTDSMNGRTPGYYLDFGSAKKISYAASFAVSKFEDEWKPFVKQMLSHFDHFSVREKTGLKILQDLGIEDGKQVVDPVFLLNKTEWTKLADLSKDYHLKEGKYILIYDFLNDDRIATFAHKLSQELHLPTVSINDFLTLPYVNKNINDAGPLEFISLIQHSASVVCSSFHASAFSLIFRKPFYVFPLKGQNNSSRMEDLLSLIGHRERFMPNAILDDMDYDSINSILDNEIERSKDVLRTFIDK